MGFDSLLSVELSKRLSASAGLRLRANLVLRHPSPRRIAPDTSCPPWLARRTPHHRVDPSRRRDTANPQRPVRRPPAVLNG
ncbi:acyl carrier protein [Streptomyces sp. KL116D]|uniref:acyl carrier protein n=1 Tax=Streptomyces sp. KL116D TaxID=3045152 RepID=UPI00355728A4